MSLRRQPGLVCKKTLEEISVVARPTTPQLLHRLDFRIHTFKLLRLNLSFLRRSHCFLVPGASLQTGYTLTLTAMLMESTPSRLYGF